MQEILVIDDDVADFKPGLEHALKGYTVHWAADGRTGLHLLEQNPDIGLVLLDVKMAPDFAASAHREGMEVLKQIRAACPELPVIMLTVMTDVELVVEAIQAGAFHYIPKPLDRDKLRETVRRAFENTALKERVDTLTRAQDAFVAVHGAAAGGQRTRFHGLVGAHPLMQRLYGQIERVAAFDKVKVVLFGETGAGKDLVAKAIHDCSARKGKPFHAVNCAAFSENVLDSELFGHEKGAFTSAGAKREGLFVSADGGTLFLDEIAETSPELQRKLLRTIENGEVRPVGADKSVRVDVRIICATNKDLAKEKQTGAFREDLYYRLCEVPLTIPPLRERREDVPLLTRHFLKEADAPGGVPELDASAMDALMDYDWPGNVRELAAVIMKLVIMGTGGRIGADQVRGALRASSDPMQTPELLSMTPATPAPLEDVPSERPPEEAPSGGEAEGVLPEVRDLGEFRKTHGEIRLKQVLEQAIRETGNAQDAMEALHITENSYGSFRKWLERLGISVRDLKG